MQIPIEKRAYVSLLSDDSYLAGLLTLHYSLMQTYPAYDFLVLLNEQVSEHSKHTLNQANIRFQSFSKLHYPEKTIATMSAKGWGKHITNTADKLNIFLLTEFDKVVYLDADMLILKNIDYLFQYPHGSAVIDLGNLVNPKLTPGYSDSYYEWVQQFNSGLFVFKPNTVDFEACLEIMKQDVGYDQEILRCLWSDWIHTPTRQLPQTCNIFASHMPQYIKHGVCGLSDVEVFHYASTPKPWNKTQYDLNNTVDFVYYLYREYMNKAFKAYSLTLS